MRIQKSVPSLLPSSTTTAKWFPILKVVIKA
jgi:hypothetical protein